MFSISLASCEVKANAEAVENLDEGINAILEWRCPLKNKTWEKYRYLTTKAA